MKIEVDRVKRSRGIEVEGGCSKPVRGEVEVGVTNREGRRVMIMVDDDHDDNNHADDDDDDYEGNDANGHGGQ